MDIYLICRKTISDNSIWIAGGYKNKEKASDKIKYINKWYEQDSDVEYFIQTIPFYE